MSIFIVIFTTNVVVWLQSKVTIVQMSILIVLQKVKWSAVYYI